jgi:uncharacterized damage-inducible protein DinB
MNTNLLARLYEHNNWANLKIAQTCATLTDEQLDADPISVTMGSIRNTLEHLASAQENYLAMFTTPVEERRKRASYRVQNFEESLKSSGNGLLKLVQSPPQTRLQTTDNHYVEPWVILAQVINHAAEHREQICSMLTELGVQVPDLDGWSYGEAENALVPMSEEKK